MYLLTTASGIPDFRSSTGLYSKKRNQNFAPEQAVSHFFFVRCPEEFFDFYKKNLVYPDAKPNDCHFALARLEKMGKLKAVITQNIDGLHQDAGSKVVYPAAGLINYFGGDNLVLINKSTTSADNEADLVINDDIAKVMKEAVAQFICSK